MPVFVGVGLIVIAAALVPVADAHATVTAAPIWGSTVTPPQAPVGDLTGVSCPTTAFCAAVGLYAADAGSPSKAEAWLRFGGRWHQSTVTDNAGQSPRGVSCLSSTFCLAVAMPTGGGGPTGFTWNGTLWKPTAAISANQTDSITGVSCVSTTWCLAVGTGTASAGRTTAMVWRYNGRRWDAGRAPTISGTASVVLNAVSCRSTSFCYTAGDWSYADRSHPWVGHFNGTSWVTSAPSAPAAYDKVVLNGIDCPTVSECTVVGGETATGEGTSITYPFTARVTTAGWTTENAPGLNGRNALLLSVDCAAAGACTAVGGDTDSDQGVPALAVTRTAGDWVLGRTPTRAAVLLRARSVACPSSSACVAVGESDGAELHEYIMTVVSS